MIIASNKFRTQRLLNSNYFTWVLFSTIFIVYFISTSYLITENQQFFYHNDGVEYDDLATSIANGHGLSSTLEMWYEAPQEPNIYQPEAFRPMLMPTLAGILLFITGSKTIAYPLLVSIVSTLCCLVGFKCALRISKSKIAAYIAILMILFDPLMFSSSLRFATDHFLLLFSFLIMWFFMQLPENRMRDYIILGFVLALAVLSRPTGILFIIPIIIARLVTSFNKREFVNLSIMVFCAALPLFAWAMRNQHNFNRFTPLTLYGGYAIWLGTNTDHYQAYSNHTGKQFIKLQNEAFNRSKLMAKSLPLNLSPALQQEYWQKQSWHNFNELGLLKYSELSMRKGLHFIQPYASAEIHGAISATAVTVCSLTVFSLGIIGWFFILKRHKGLCIYSMLLVTFGTLAHALTYVVLRYRTPFIDSSAIILASVVISIIIRKLKNKDKPERS